MTTTTATDLPPELVEQVMKLSPGQQDRLMDLLFAAMDGQPDNVSAVIAERAERVARGNYSAMTREESDRRIREAVRKHGFEL